ncbi:Cof-type HAD-IIB family hydrolase [Vibrio ostreicida]|uniref:Cof-type HAD-IIB family hydrolase n=1 Tax=Vibrio ostreicida TaxID=526588 RepID=A0ABT8BVH8_9VIBR|nr:Cof-type HAD-IIB family hydrolase [Vibrio ostreicida]MDN3610102.1 Cof-type HAD-IIB family hydrolase [Vibrio ostreicida]NPD07873.1 Cof-type HAD-IIB family hydrolase [Vibrio ostreicida]
MYKLIALDMDGTLLTSDRSISQRTKTAIRKAREQGVKIVLASGRPPEGMRQKLTELDIEGNDEYIVTYNGSLATSVGSGVIIHQAYIDGKRAKKVAAFAKEIGLYCHAFSTEYGLITPKNNPYTRLESDVNQISVSEFDFSSLEDNHPIIKAMIVGEPEKIKHLTQAIPHSLKALFTIVQSAPFFLEFLSLESNKGLGVKAIADSLNIHASEVISIGDAENDHHMIEYAGLGVAMENAMENTKAIADCITSSNDEHGVAKIIEAHVLR